MISYFNNMDDDIPEDTIENNSDFAISDEEREECANIGIGIDSINDNRIEGEITLLLNSSAMIDSFLKTVKEYGSDKALLSFVDTPNFRSMFNISKFENLDSVTSEKILAFEGFGDMIVSFFKRIWTMITNMYKSLAKMFKKILYYISEILLSGGDGRILSTTIDLNGYFNEVEVEFVKDAPEELSKMARVVTRIFKVLKSCQECTPGTKDTVEIKVRELIKRIDEFNDFETIKEKAGNIDGFRSFVKLTHSLGTTQFNRIRHEWLITSGPSFKVLKKIGDDLEFVARDLTFANDSGLQLKPSLLEDQDALKEFKIFSNDLLIAVGKFNTRAQKFIAVCATAVIVVGNSVTQKANSN